MENTTLLAVLTCKHRSLYCCNYAHKNRTVSDGLKVLILDISTLSISSVHCTLYSTSLIDYLLFTRCCPNQQNYLVSTSCCIKRAAVLQSLQTNCSVYFMLFIVFFVFFVVKFLYFCSLMYFFQVFLSLQCLCGY